ncbi:ribokinase [Rhizobium sp. L1K21]|uniref:ribokinase n=1 Tax=Rhizobium sp. L1K21 TaxID=2954933 RepID=UPI0020931761|nr:ribokinase [Rhizobium sp. L1K21]MCO6185554.1 ribokinase [Rhizobium sp. L1K21]
MITVFGSINMDLTATTDRLPKPGETVGGKTFATAAGGKGANQALAARRAGAEVKMAGAVGNDSFAKDALALLADAGTDLSLVRTTNGPTGTALILVGGDGENMIAVVPGANGELTEKDAIAAVDATPPGSYMLFQFEIPSLSVESAIYSARAKRIKTVINTAPMTADGARIARLADIVIANETEFELFAEEPKLDAVSRQKVMEQLHEKTGQTLVVTLGSKGVIAVHGGEVMQVPAREVVPVDTVGAGDTFCGYLAASLDAGMPFKEAMRRAAVAGSLACTKAGAQPAIPWAAEVDA